MKVLLASAEAAPFAKVGGLADVVGSLPAALRTSGADTRVVMPGYGFIDHYKYNISRLFAFEFTHKNGTSQVQVFTCIYDGVPIYFLQSWPYFGEDSSVYTTWDWDIPRFIFFNQMAMAFIWQLHERLGWIPDVVNVSDWHTALLPFLIYESRKSDPHWQRIATALTIHNIAYQGENVGGFLWDAGISARSHPSLDHDGLSDNLLAIGSVYSDYVITVSPRYANEIQHSYAGFNLAPLMKQRAQVGELIGILNGIDTKRWNPATDKYLIAPYDTNNVVESRKLNKRHLQSFARLPIRDDIPVVGMVTRLVWQKGLDLALPALRRLLIDTEMQFIVLGTGDPELEYQLWRLAQDFSWKAAAFLEFDAALSQHIYAAADMFLMPSHFEPCGIGQMLAMRYGSLPIVRETGGLADTVINYDNQDADMGTGFVFQYEEPDAVINTLRWALRTYYNRPEAWLRMQKRAMKQDFSWDQSAQQYIALFKKSMEKHKKIT
ncbi:glycogen synthase [Phototrophicus methaneseepsis]|uniref:Glycogen synthase n=1 Tax=Phototrophicus methaneseepsis TaxID=2710758 RepID=A0A7S8E7F7_9CHLR|nr:glycogen/starch synthase [Phototrophicus methaneseepsis]QPC81775.1 glycogen synthase [Phototrophicus methaneseepsis]